MFPFFLGSLYKNWNEDKEIELQIYYASSQPPPTTDYDFEDFAC